MKDLDTFIINCKFIRKFTRAIGRPIVDKQQLKIIERLPEDRLYTLLKI